jgi:hypothetical protein
VEDWDVEGIGFEKPAGRQRSQEEKWVLEYPVGNFKKICLLARLMLKPM